MTGIATKPRLSAASNLLVLSVFALNLVPASALWAQTNAPLVQESDIRYLGGFALPSGSNMDQYGTSNFEYGGRGLTHYRDPSTGKDTLYIEGHAQNPGQIAQVEIPNTFVKSENWEALPKAAVLQNFVEVPASPHPASCSGAASHIYGMLAYNGRLIIGAGCSYGGSQTTSHGVRSLDLSQEGFSGFYGFSGATASPRALGGPMTTIPQEWQGAFGGAALTGNCCISIIGSTSAGPSVTVFDPNDVSVRTPIPGKTALFYPLEHPACGAEHCEAAQQETFNLTTGYGGVAFPRGSRSVLFIVAQGIGEYCYGEGDQCNDPVNSFKGPHAHPYRYQILAYDANDLVSVINGEQQPWEPKPYSIMVLDGMPNSYNNQIKGAAYDAKKNRLYIAQDYAESPRIEVYEISVPGSGAEPPVKIEPPMNLRFQ